MSTDNRAVSALFRVFGGTGDYVVAHARECTNTRGMHLGECRAFSILVPLTLFVGIGGWLSSVLGVGTGWIFAFPAAFLALNILPFVLRAKDRRLQWLLWSSTGIIWAIFHRNDSGIVGFFSYLWIGIAVMESGAQVVLLFQRLMRLSGTWGISLRISLLILMHVAAIAIGMKFGWLWGIASGAGVAAVFCWAILNPYSQWLGPVLTTAGDGILITIDDGPDPHDTPLLLDLLDRYRVKAIFFMIGEKVRAHPELAREVIHRGHEIGDHTLSHPQASFWCASPWSTRREIAGCQQIIEDVTGTKPRWFRAPVGHRNLFTHPIASVLGLRVIAWNRRGYDAVTTDAEKVLARILPNLTNGDIVLLHESTPIAVEVLGKVLEKASFVV